MKHLHVCVFALLVVCDWTGQCVCVFVFVSLCILYVCIFVFVFVVSVYLPDCLHPPQLFLGQATLLVSLGV